LAEFGGVNYLTLKHDMLMPGQFVAARILNVPERASSSVVHADVVTAIDMQSLAPAFTDAVGIGLLRERTARGEEIVEGYGNISRPKSRKKREPC
jgi:hypothetical protein